MPVARPLLRSLSIIALVALLMGCDGEKGPRGRTGATGQSGEDGVDTELSTPGSKYLSICVSNASKYPMSGSNTVTVVFDSMVRAGMDTVKANYVATPPLLDGLDGGEGEWGKAVSKLRLSFHKPTGQSGARDPKIYEALCRAAYDEDFVYLLVQWREANVRGSGSGGDSTFFFPGNSIDVNALFINLSKPDIVIKSGSRGPKVDTIFTNLRSRSYVRLDSFCLPPPPADPIICEEVTVVVTDTFLVWKSTGSYEDFLVVTLSDEKVEKLSETVFQPVAQESKLPSGFSPGAMVDVWRWGATTTNPLNVADDWSLTDAGLTPDIGDPPFIDNWILPDSAPKYMHRLDPNLRTSFYFIPDMYPFWYYESEGYSPRGWTRENAAYVPGIVTTIPSGSRRDVCAKGVFFQNAWTVEMKRARRTGNGDDLKF